MSEHPKVRCELCGREVSIFSSYVVRIDVFAEPSLPPISTEELKSLNLAEALAEANEQAEGLTADDLQDSVHRRFEYRLCPACQKPFLANPLGKPRRAGMGAN